MKIFGRIILLLCLLGNSCSKKSGGSISQPPIQNSNTFTNPLLPSGPDPWVIEKDNIYYYTNTLGNRISIWKTSKITELKNTNPQTIWSAPVNGPNAHNVWAPELHFIDNKWYAYYTAGSSTADLSMQRSFVLENSSADPLSGSWIDKGKIYDPSADFFAIDGTVLNYNSNNYFIWSGHSTAVDNTQRIYIARMQNPWTLGSSRSLISSPQYSWETSGSPPAVNEGPEILKNPAGKIFLIFSASGCWTDDYSLGMMTLSDNGDPMNAADWTKSPQPVFQKNPSAAVFGPGHNSFFKSADGSEDWIIYHANPATGLGCGDNRNPRIQKFTWNADGTPAFGIPVSTSTALQKPSGE